MTIFLIQVRGTAIENRFLHHEAEGASEASTRAKRAAHDPKCIRLGVNTCRRPLSVFIPECTTAWSTMEPTGEPSEWTMGF